MINSYEASDIRTLAVSHDSAGLVYHIKTYQTTGICCSVASGLPIDFRYSGALSGSRVPNNLSVRLDMF